ncbi:MAG: Hsp20 family protein [Cyanobacteria bacterium RI_101]|nr:Hsp20 family protein [Cyanobacteria bacterium RI_101]
MTLTRYNPFRELDLLQRQMNRLFDEAVLPAERELERLAFTPVAELTEADDGYTLKLELPGINPEHLDIQATKESVAISGERQSQHTEEHKGVTRTEFRYGKFQRVIPLPSPIENTAVSADYKDGILTLTLPKAEEAKNKVVKVKLGEG